jgi:DNA-directed RNA polymerase subunit L
MRVYLSSIFLFLISHKVNCQNLRIDSLINQIKTSQITKHNNFYSAGLFLSTRNYLKSKQYKRQDDNIFFTGLIVWTLRNQQQFLSPTNKNIVDSICSKAVSNYPNYRNKNGDCTYNFWQPKPNRHFPNDQYFSTRKKYALPDDLDDTSILYLSEHHSDSLKNCLRTKIAQHANGNSTYINNTFRKYKHDVAYNSWFGNKIDVDFDICVQSNALSWVLDNHFVLNKYDSATINLIQKMVLADEHIKYAQYISPHYQTPSIVLYHLARLIAPHHDYFTKIKSKLIDDIQQQIKIVKHPMEKLLLATSLARFGVFSEQNLKLNKSDFEGFYFFVANMTSVAPNPFKRWFAKCKRTNFYYESEGYYYTLLLEYECLMLKNSNN